MYALRREEKKERKLDLILASSNKEDSSDSSFSWVNRLTFYCFWLRFKGAEDKDRQSNSSGVSSCAKQINYYH